MRTGPNELSFRTASAIKSIYAGKPSPQDTFRKNMIANIQETGEVSNIFFATDNSHARYRKLVGPAFSERTIRAQEPMLQEYCNQLIRGLRNRTGTRHYPTCDGVVDMVPWTQFIVSDILSHMLFGSGLGCVERGEYHPWVRAGYKALIESTYIEAAHRLGSYYAIVEYLIIPPSIRDGFRTHLAISQQKLEQRSKEADPYGFDFPSIVSGSMTKEEVFDNINVVATAAGETTSSALSAALYYLTTNPTAYRKLVTEIRQAFETEQDITAASTASLTYLKATIRESFRIHPTIPVGLHRVTPGKGSSIDDSWVPGGVSTFTPQRHQLYMRYRALTSSDYI